MTPHGCPPVVLDSVPLANSLSIAFTSRATLRQCCYLPDDDLASLNNTVFNLAILRNDEDLIAWVWKISAPKLENERPIEAFTR